VDSGASIKVTYWAEQTGARRLHDLDGAEEFRADLERDYITVVHARPGDLGGLLHLAVEFVSSISMADLAQCVASGMAWDVIKSGARSVVLRPFIHAYHKLKARNPDIHLDIEIVRLIMSDSVLLIYRLEDDSIVRHLGKILVRVAAEYEHLVLRSGETPFEIHVPVFEDPTDERLSRFRLLLDVDEVLTPKPEVDYFRLWGLQYDFSRTTRVYDVARHLLVDEEFLTQERYAFEWEAKGRRAPGR
jgi:hypothetical protein